MYSLLKCSYCCVSSFGFCLLWGIKYICHTDVRSSRQLILEIGNEHGNVLLSIMNLPHTARFYRLIINRPEINFILMKSKFSASLRWDKGISISNTALNYLVLPFPRKVPVPYWQIGQLSQLLCGHHYALIQIITIISSYLTWKW